MEIELTIQEINEIVEFIKFHKNTIYTGLWIILVSCVYFFIVIGHSKLMANYSHNGTLEKLDGTNVFHTFWGFTKNNHRRPQPSKVASKRWLILILLACSGDIELNPGPEQILTVTVKKWSKTVYAIEIEKKQHGYKIVGLNARAHEDGLRVEDTIISVENRDVQPPQLLQEDSFKNNFFGFKNLQFTVIRDASTEQYPSPAAKMQPHEHQWKTPERVQQVEKPLKDKMKSAKQLFDEASNVVESPEVHKDDFDENLDEITTGTDSLLLQESNYPTEGSEEKATSSLNKLKQWAKDKKKKKARDMETDREKKREHYSNLTPASKESLMEKARRRYSGLTPETKEAYKQTAGEAAKRRYQDLTPETKETYKQTAGEAAKQRYQDLTPESKESYKIAASEAATKRYHDLTPQSKETYKQAASERTKPRYDKLTPDSKESYKHSAGESAKLRYSMLTPQSKDSYKEKAGTREQTHYADMTPLSKQERKSKAAGKVLTDRMEMTPETKAAKKAERKEKKSKKREDMSPNSKELLLKFQAEQKAGIRKRRAEESNAKSKDSTYQEQWESFRQQRIRFQKQIDIGCPYICVVCFTNRYRHQVIRFHREKYAMAGTKGSDTVSLVLNWTDELPCSPDGNQYICKSNCHEKLKACMLPNCAIANGLGLDRIPPELAKLGPLEARLISKRFIFYKIIQRGIGAKMPKIRGSITNVPVLWNIDVERCLPRNFKNSGLLALKLKRRMQYKSTVLYHTVRVPVLFDALKWLKQNHPDYADIEIENVDDFIKKCKDHDQELHDELFVYDDKPLVDLIEQEDLKEPESESDNDDKSDVELDDIILRNENFEDTMVMENDGPLDVLDCDQRTDQTTEEKKLSHMVAVDIAPAEGKTPLSIFRDPSFEILAHPHKFPRGKFGYETTDRTTQLHLGEYIQNRLFSADPRFTTSADWIFAMAYKLEYKRLWSALDIQMRQSKSVNSEGQRLTAGFLLTKENRQALLNKDIGFKFMKQIRATPAYWNNAMRQVLCMVKNFGKPTWFFTLSCADTQWPDMLKNVYFRAHGRILSDHELEQLTWTEKCNHLRNDPTFVSRQWQHRVREFFRLILLNPRVAPLGQVTDYFYRIEFQQRGAPHIHGIFWVRNAPDLDKNTTEEVCKFIDDHITVEIPDEGVSEEQDELRHEVISKQTHSCRSTCYKSAKAKFEKKCRFGYPKSVCEKTVICGLEPEPDEENEKDKDPQPIDNKDEIEPQADTKNKVYTKITVELRRTIDELMMNPYNRMMSLGWKGNLDTQYITDYYAVIVYILSYICKSEGEMSTLMKNAAENLPDSCTAREFLKEGANAFLKGREVGLLESVFRSCSSLLLKYQTRKVVYIPVGYEGERIRLIKDAESLAAMDKESTEIFAPNLLEKYADRSPLVENLCLAEFAAYYEQETKKKKKKTKGEPDNAMESEMGSNLSDGGEVEDDENLSTKVDNSAENTVAEDEMDKWPNRIKAAGKWFRKRTKRTAINYRTFNVTKNPERYYYSKVLLFMPWRDEATNLADCMENPAGFFNDNYDMFKDKLLLFEPENLDEIEMAMEYFRENRQDLEDAMDDIAPEGMREFRENAEDDDEAFLFAQFGADSEPPNPNVDKDLGTAKKNPEFAKTEIMTEDAYEQLINSLNKKQHEIFKLLDDWCISVVSARRQGLPEPTPLLKFISGPGGTGKSHLLKAMRQSTQRHFAVNYGHEGKPGDDKLVARSPEELVSLVLAFTGRAANNVSGQTLHSALSLITDFTSRAGNEGHLTSEKIQFLKNVYHYIEVIFIDEISMVSIELLYQIHERLQVLKSEFVGSSKKLFGGITIITFGDLYQLPPVAQPQIFEDPWKEATKAKAITGHLWRNNFEILELIEIMRQKGDQKFAELLNRIRTGHHTIDDIAALESRIVSEDNCPPDAPRAYPTNKLCRQYNDKKISELSKTTNLTTIKAEDNFANAVLDGKKRKEGTWAADIDRATDFANNDDGKHTGGLMTELTICKNARVMLTKNFKVSDGLCNGSIGTVRDIVKLRQTDNMPIFVLVEFDGENDFIPGTVYRKEFFSNDKIRRKLEVNGINHHLINDSWIPIPTSDQQFFGKGSKIMIERRMIPLRIGFAATIHKFQGATVKELVVSFEGRSPKQIAHGQAYVALSRVTTLQGLFLLNFDKDVIHHNPKVDLEMQRLKYGIEYLDIKSISSRGKKNKKETNEEPAKRMEKLSMEEPSFGALKCLQLSTTKPDSFFVKDFSCYTVLVRNWIADNSALLHQLESYYHEMAQKSEKTEKCQRNKRVKDISGPVGYQVIYNSQNGNSLYCSVSILLIGSMKLERTLRALSTTFYCQLHAFLHSIKTDLELNDSSLFKDLFLRGHDGNVAAAFCLCCALGARLNVVKQLTDGTFELHILSPESFNDMKNIPYIGTVLLTNGGQFWPMVPSSECEPINAVSILFETDCTIEQILCHNWEIEQYTNWDDFDNVRSYDTTKKTKQTKPKQTERKPQTSKTKGKKPPPTKSEKPGKSIIPVSEINYTPWTTEARHSCRIWLQNNTDLLMLYDQMKNAPFNFEEMQIFIAQSYAALDQFEELLLTITRSSVRTNCSLPIGHQNQQLHPAFTKAFSAIATPGDGNCWLHMLTISMFGHFYMGTRLISDVLRMVAVRYAMKHEQELKNYYPETEVMHHYMCNQAFYASVFVNGRWGNENSLLLMSSLMCRPIYIYGQMKDIAGIWQAAEYCNSSYEELLAAYNLGNLQHRPLLTGLARYEPIHEWREEHTPLLGYFSPGHYTCILPNTENVNELIKPRVKFPI